MSWLFAHTYPEGTSPSLLQRPDGAPLWSVSVPGLRIAVGGNPDTCFYAGGGGEGWAVVGTGIALDGSCAKILGHAGWSRLLNQPRFDPTALDGHFVVVRWSQGSVECFTDQLGLRTVYHAPLGNGTVLSTRQDWVARATGLSEIDFAALAGRWLLVNQLSYDACVKGIRRVGPGGRALFHGGSCVSSTSTPWLPAFDPAASSAALDRLASFVRGALESGRPVSLGLSGGVDSRMLLALISASRVEGCEAYTFGDSTEPDVRLAERLAGAVSLPLRRFDESLPTPEELLPHVRAFAAQAELAEPVSSYAKLRYYSLLRREGRLMVDGGFGEVARRQYMNRLVRLGGPALRNRDWVRLADFMRVGRADVFSEDGARTMEGAVLRTLEVALDGMPRVEEIGLENFADLFAVRTRIPNYGGPEQARLDGEVVNFMPFAQPSFLRVALGVPVRSRANGAWFRSAIRRLAPAAARFPFVKSGVTYPFGMSTNAAWVWTRVKSRVAGGYVDSAPDLLLHVLKEFVQDAAHSRAVAADGLFDALRVREAVDQYYGGDAGMRGNVDWWLTFELWRRSLTGR